MHSGATWTDTLRFAATGRVARAVAVTVRRDSAGFYTYSFRELDPESGTAEGWERHGTWRFVPLSPPEAVLADLNFDGLADLWVSGCAGGGQCRVFESDVWLYRPPVGYETGLLRVGGVYERSGALSSLASLAFDPERELVSAGIGNCGGGGACHRTEYYAVEGNELRLVGRLVGSNGPNDYGCRTEEVEGGAPVVIARSGDPWACPVPRGFEPWTAAQ